MNFNYSYFKLFKTTGFCLLLSINLFTGKAQVLLPLQADRPDQTETVSTIPRNFFQIESGFSKEHTNKEEKGYEFPSVLWKYGATNNTELRLITELVREAGKTEFSPVYLGFKTAIAEAKGLFPKTSLIAHLGLNKTSPEHPICKTIIPAFRFAFENNLTESSSLGYNAGMEWDAHKTNPVYIYTMAYGHSLTERLGAYIETYGFYGRKVEADSRIDGGVTYHFNPNLMLDFSSGMGLSQSAPCHFVSLGFSYRRKLH